MSKLITLTIRHANVTPNIFHTLLKAMKSLSIVDASHNAISMLYPASEHKPLEILDLSDNILTTLQSFIFKNLPDLTILILHHNPIRSIARWAFEGLVSLEVIDLTSVSLKMIFVSDLPKYSNKLRVMESDHLGFCCLLDFVSDCVPKLERFSSCDDLLSNKLHQGIITLQAVITLTANMAVVVLQSYLNKHERCQMIHLTLANLLMALYLSTLTAADIYYRGNFSQVAIDWVHGVFCNIIAALNFVASEVALSLLVFMSCSRAYVIHTVWTKVSKKVNWIICFSIWSFWTIYTALWFLVMTHFQINLESNICILVFFTDVRHTITTYLQSISFVVINTLNISIIVIAYACIAWNIYHNSKKCLKSMSKQKQEERRKRHLHFAVKLCVIIFCNFSCWIPMIVSVLLAVLGVPLPEDLAVWMALLVIPVNASFCPIMFGLLPILRDACKRKTKPPVKIKLELISP